MFSSIKLNNSILQLNMSLKIWYSGHDAVESCIICEKTIPELFMALHYNFAPDILDSIEKLFKLCCGKEL